MCEASQTQEWFDSLARIEHMLKESSHSDIEWLAANSQHSDLEKFKQGRVKGWRHIWMSSTYRHECDRNMALAQLDSST